MAIDVPTTSIVSVVDGYYSRCNATPLLSQCVDANHMSCVSYTEGDVEDDQENVSATSDIKTAKQIN